MISKHNSVDGFSKKIGEFMINHYFLRFLSLITSAKF